MVLDAYLVNRLVDSDLERVSEPRVLSHIRDLRVEPKEVMRLWDYGEPGQRFPCWSVFEHKASNTGIAYCEEGFGPKHPWGLVFLDGDESQRSIGVDTSWFETFLDAYFDSMASCDLAIWCVVKTDASGAQRSLTKQGGWDETWEQVYLFREKDPGSRYDCEHDIALRAPTSSRY
ncbi:MAG: hypothetical protein QNJ67_23350 [Kiloniellales bacterium]|nr:hypothetical protein [Kiloniellales bacterium]